MRECLREIKRRAVKGKDLLGWEEERRGYFRKRRGLDMEELEKLRNEEGGISERLVKVGKKLQRKERWEKINESTYNKWYEMIKNEGIPGYLKKNWGESRWRRLARFRLGNEVREGRYWLGEEDKLCRLCGYRR